MSEEEKVEATVLSLEEEGFLWYQFEDDRSPLTDWQEIKSMILKYFRPSEDGDLFEQWMAIEQRRSLAEYRKEFVTRLKHLGRVDEPVMLGTFLRGLKDEVKYELKVMGPTTLEQAMVWAERIDQKLRAQTWLGRRISQPKNYPPRNSKLTFTQIITM